MFARRAVLRLHPVSSLPDIPILELTPSHPVKNNFPHFTCLREPILQQPLSFQIYAGMGGVPPFSSMGSIRSELPSLALSPLPATLMAIPARRCRQKTCGRPTAHLSSLDATLAKNRGRGKRQATNQLVSTFKPTDASTSRRLHPLPLSLIGQTPPLCLIYIVAVLSSPLCVRGIARSSRLGGCHE